MSEPGGHQSSGMSFEIHRDILYMWHLSDPTQERRRLSELDQKETVLGRATAKEIEVQFIALWYQETLGHVIEQTV